MKILNISLDKKITDKNSAVAKRIVEYGELVERYTVLVLADKDEIINLSSIVQVVSARKAGRISSWFKLKKKAEEILSTDEFDVITAQDAYFLGWLALQLSRKFNIGLEVQVHGFEKFYGLRKIIAKQVIKKADAVRVVSQRLQKKLIDEFGVAEDRITMVPIYTEVRSQGSEVRSQRGGSFIFLTVGRLAPVKNIKMQIKAMTEVVKKHKDVKLWVVGDGEELRSIKFEVRKLDLENQIKLWGWNNDVQSYYSQIDAFLLTSNSEGWGISVVEAASYGLPIIMTDVGLAREVIKGGESGIVIPVGDQKALERAMIKLLESPELREELGQGAKKAVKKLPSKERTLELYKESWQKAIDNKKI